MNKLGIITALLPEARCFIKSPVPNTPITISEKLSLIVSGIGQEKAVEAAKLLLKDRVSALLITGTCGALSPDLNPGDLVIPKIILSEDKKSYLTNPEWYHQVFAALSTLPIKIHNDNLLSTDRLIPRSIEKQTIYKETGAIAVDMESAAVIKLANLNQIPVLVIRTVIDPSDFSIPEFIIKNSNIYGDVNIYALLKSCIANPGEFRQVFQLMNFYRLAMKNLKLLNKKRDQLVFPIL